MLHTRLLTCVLALGSLLSLTTAQAQSGNLVLKDCLISAFNEVDVPAAEAGVLLELNDLSREGTYVQESMELGKIDDSDAISKANSALYEIKVSQAQAESQAEYLVAVKTKEVSEQDLQAARDANRRAPGTVSDTEIRRLVLTVERADQEIALRKMERANHGLTAQSKSAQRQTFINEIERRKIKAPISGIVVERMKKRGEWVQPGETILKIVGLEQLRVNGFVSAAKYSPQSIHGALVKVKVEIPNAAGTLEVQEVTGKITFVSPIVETSGDFRVWAEVENQKLDNTHWLLRPGTMASMEIIPNSNRVSSVIKSNR